MKRYYFFACEVLSTLLLQRVREEHNLAFPAGTYEPVGWLVAEPFDIGDLLADIQRFIRGFVEHNRTREYIVKLYNSTLESNQQMEHRWIQVTKLDFELMFESWAYVISRSIIFLHDLKRVGSLTLTTLQTPLPHQAVNVDRKNLLGIWIHEKASDLSFVWGQDKAVIRWLRFFENAKFRLQILLIENVVNIWLLILQKLAQIWLLPNHG